MTIYNVMRYAFNVEKFHYNLLDYGLYSMSGFVCAMYRLDSTIITFIYGDEWYRWRLPLPVTGWRSAPLEGKCVPNETTRFFFSSVFRGRMERAVGEACCSFDRFRAVFHQRTGSRSQSKLCILQCNAMQCLSGTNAVYRSLADIFSYDYNVSERLCTLWWATWLNNNEPPARCLSFISFEWMKHFIRCWMFEGMDEMKMVFGELNKVFRIRFRFRCCLSFIPRPHCLIQNPLKSTPFKISRQKQFARSNFTFSWKSTFKEISLSLSHLRTSHTYAATAPTRTSETHPSQQINCWKFLLNVT